MPLGDIVLVVRAAVDLRAEQLRVAVHAPHRDRLFLLRRTAVGNQRCRHVFVRRKIQGRRVKGSIRTGVRFLPVQVQRVARRADDGVPGDGRRPFVQRDRADLAEEVQRVVFALAPLAVGRLHRDGAGNGVVLIERPFEDDGRIRAAVQLGLSLPDDVVRRAEDGIPRERPALRIVRDVAQSADPLIAQIVDVVRLVAFRAAQIEAYLPDVFQVGILR